MSSLRLFRTFLAVATEGTFTAAAHRVALTQAAVGLQMRTLERDLKQTLFSRHGKVVMLNDNGHALVPLAKQMLTLYGRMLEQAHDSQPMAGSVHLGAIVSALPKLLRATLTLKERHPDLDLHVSAAKSVQLAASVESGKLDCAILVRDPGSAGPGLLWQTLYSEPMVMLAPANAHETSIKALLERYPFIRFERTEQTGQLVERSLRRLRLAPSEFLELNSLDAIADLVRTSLGVTILPLPHLSAWRQDPALRVIELPAVPESREIALLHWRESTKSAIVSAVIKELLAQDEA